MMTRGQFAQVLAPGLHHLFVQWNDLFMKEMEYDKIFNMETSESAYEDEAEFAGFAPMNEKPEGEPINYTEALEGPSKRFQHTTFAQGIRTSWELIEDDKYNLIQQTPKALARSAQFRQEMDAANIFNLGFTTVVSNDGVSLFNTQHPLLGGPEATSIAPGLTVGDLIVSAGTYPNRPTSDMDLSISALQTAVRHSERLIDGMGYPIVARPRHLFIPPELIFVAIELLASPHDPKSASNAVNSILRQGFDFIVGHYLTSSSAWFLLCDKEYHQLKFFWRHRLDEDYSDDFDTLSMKHIAYMRYSVGVTTWLGTWGTSGP